MEITDYEIRELLKAAKDVTDKEKFSDDCTIIVALRKELWDLFKACQVPNEIQTEIHRATFKTSLSENQYTFTLDKLDYSNEDGLKLNMSYQTVDKQEHTIIMKKDENGNYMTIVDTKRKIPVRQGIVESVINRRTSKENSKGLYECQIDRISQEYSLSGDYTPSPKLNIESVGTEILDGTKRINLDECDQTLTAEIYTK